MSDDRHGHEEKSFLGRIAQAFSSEPNSREELQSILKLAIDNDIIDEDAHSIIEGAMEVSAMQARDIMVPRPQMVCIKASSTLEEILPEIIRSKHSRYPVIGESPDDVLGVLLAKDLLPQILRDDKADFAMRTLLRQSVVVPESKRLNVLLREFLPIVVFRGVAIGLGRVLLAAAAVAAVQNPDPEKVSAYECGFNAFDDARMKFDVRFYLVAILFIIFDLEVAFLFPWAVAFKDIGDVGYWSMIVFLAVLTVGFAYEWKKGALEWE